MSRGADAYWLVRIDQLCLIGLFERAHLYPKEQRVAVDSGNHRKELHESVESFGLGIQDVLPPCRP